MPYQVRGEEYLLSIPTAELTVNQTHNFFFLLERYNLTYDCLQLTPDVEGQSHLIETEQHKWERMIELTKIYPQNMRPRLVAHLWVYEGPLRDSLRVAWELLEAFLDEVVAPKVIGFVIGRVMELTQKVKSAVEADGLQEEEQGANATLDAMFPLQKFQDLKAAWESVPLQYRLHSSIAFAENPVSRSEKYDDEAEQKQISTEEHSQRSKQILDEAQEARDKSEGNDITHLDETVLHAKEAYHRVQNAANNVWAEAVRARGIAYDRRVQLRTLRAGLLSSRRELDSTLVQDRYCSLCRNPYGLLQDGPEQRPRQLPCGHHFGSLCKLRWLQEHNNCPTCDRNYEIELGKPPRKKKDPSSRDP
jgi:hypothetical protein